MYQNFEGLERIEDIKKISFFFVFPHALGKLNQKTLWPTLIYQFEHLYQWFGTPYPTGCCSNPIMNTDFHYFNTDSAKNATNFNLNISGFKDQFY